MYCVGDTACYNYVLLLAEEYNKWCHCRNDRVMSSGAAVLSAYGRIVALTAVLYVSGIRDASGIHSG